jgi:hypothetical protein
MAEKFHINTKGEPGRCHAQHGGCPFGGEDEHYATKEGASAAYERSMQSDTLPKLEKAPTRAQVDQVLDAMSRGEDTIPEGVEFVERRKDQPAAPKPPVIPERVAVLHSAIQEEIDWCLEEENRLKVNVKQSLLATAHTIEHFGEESRAFDDALDSENTAFYKLQEVERYRKGLEDDSKTLIDSKSGSTKVTELRESLREKRLKRELHNLLYESHDGTPSLRTLEEKTSRPIRRDEDYRNYLRQGGTPLSDSDLRSTLRKHEEQRLIQLQLDAEAKKRRASELPERAAKRNAEVDAAVNERVRLFAQDEENLKTFNRFPNRVRRLFAGKKKTLSDRDQLNAMPSGRKLIDYDPTGNQATVWTKTGENSWVNDRLVFSTDNDRKLPATVVE